MKRKITIAEEVKITESIVEITAQSYTDPSIDTRAVLEEARELLNEYGSGPTYRIEATVKDAEDADMYRNPL